MERSLAAPVVLNEYNATDADEYLGGGTAAADETGGQASDSYFGRIMGNGGDWFELVVVADHLDMRRWLLDIYEDGILDETLMLSNHGIWSDLRRGTIITISEDVASDVSYDPAAGDWWINIQANDTADGLYIERSSFPVSSTNWQLRIRTAAGTPVFGPVGEGVYPVSGVGSTEVFKLEGIPSETTTPTATDYDAGKDLSTFGSPNRWGIQDLEGLRAIIGSASTLTLTSPNGGELVQAGSLYDITWAHTGTIARVQVDFSVDGGTTWVGVYPPNLGNSGVYSWLVPHIQSSHCLVRISNPTYKTAQDASNAVFSVYVCTVEGDLTADCEIDFNDLAILAASWLNCGSPYGCDE